jgi:hypothetical protein
MTGRGKARLSAKKVAKIFMDSENYLFDDDSDDSSAEWDWSCQGSWPREGSLPDPGWAGCRVCKKRGTVKSVKLPSVQVNVSTSITL